MPDSRIALAEGGVPVCPYCGCTRHDSERLHDGNVMSHAELVDAMVMLFLRDPDEPRPAGIWPDPFPEAYPPDAVRRLRAKMEVAFGAAVRNMPYLAALRADHDAGGAVAMREAAWQTLDDCPEDGRWIWVVGGCHDEPFRTKADGGFWRYAAQQGSQTPPTHWHPDIVLPPLPAALASQEGSGC